MTLAESNSKLVSLARLICADYAQLWNKFRKDFYLKSHADFCLSEAIRLRDLANRWQKNPCRKL